MPPEPPPSLAVAEPDHDVAMPERIQLGAGRGEQLNGPVVGVAEAIGVPPEPDGVMPPPATPSPWPGKKPADELARSFAFTESFPVTRIHPREKCPTTSPAPNGIPTA